MLTYLSSRGCPKCGGARTKDEYRAEEVYFFDGRTYPEVIRRTCCRCTYTWDEAPIDQALEPPPPSEESGYLPLAERT